MSKKYFEAKEKAAMYPRKLSMHESKLFENKEIDQEALDQLFLKHQDKFDHEYKQKLFELGKKELVNEAMNKYHKTKGQAKLHFLALDKHSQSKLDSSYFKDETCHEKMDNLVDRLKLYKVLNY